MDGPEVSVQRFAEAVKTASALQKVLREALPGSKIVPFDDLAQITEAHWEKFNTYVLAGVSATVAARSAFHMSPQRFKKLLADGATATVGTLAAQFMLNVRAVQAEARGVAEARTFAENPTAWLDGPGGAALEPEGEAWHGSADAPGGGAGAPVVYLHGILTPEKWQELYGSPEARQRTLATIPTEVVEEDPDGPTDSV